MRKRLFSGIAIAASLALTAGLSACSSDGGDEDAPLEDSYTYATDTSFVHFEFKEDGKYVGFDIDLITAVADEAGFELKQEVTNFDGIIPGLQTGSFDLAVAGISITDERKQTIDFSDPYCKSGLILGVPTDNEDIKSIDDLDGKTVATRLGSTSAAYIEDNIEGAEAKTYEQLDQAYLAVESGSADAVLYTSRTSPTTSAPKVRTSSRWSATCSRLRTTASRSRRTTRTSSRPSTKLWPPSRRTARTRRCTRSGSAKSHRPKTDTSVVRAQRTAGRGAIPCPQSCGRKICPV
ncbi:transporter substrate-binding domain-containing protein [Brevibacterium epidermidis]|uniref:transporter substrate-binding domain-containing protein n=1 Tax=Brevibacterium epidermidis TaxID=1698 RepID=UPI001A7E19F3|nr:transporter substrate-binding domain-containing protein [Brevibacterium epidermidis]